MLSNARWPSNGNRPLLARLLLTPVLSTGFRRPFSRGPSRPLAEHRHHWPGTTTYTSILRPIANTVRRVSTSLGPNELLEKLLVPTTEDVSEYKKFVAQSRDFRFQTILLQMRLRREAAHDPHDVISDSLPTDEEWKVTLAIYKSRGFTTAHLEYFLYALEAPNDNERCERLLAQDQVVPLCLVHFILRPTSSTLSDATLLARLINRCSEWYGWTRAWREEGGERTTVSRLGIDQKSFARLLDRLCEHIWLVEPRLIIMVVDFTKAYIKALFERDRPPSIINKEQCRIFNLALEHMRPSGRGSSPQGQYPNAYCWEAQRMLLDFSSTFEKPLKVGARGFRAIRYVLAGLPKNTAEIQNSLRQAPSWPPYLRAATGMDEDKELDEGWSRTVRAGMLMEEAGHAMNDSDRALDILQGRSPDGLPTIQQRVIIAKSRRIRPLEAIIRATRNAQEAWHIFQNPPLPGSRPGRDDYAAMMEKLVLRDAEPEDGVLPGDKQVNFEPHFEPNLTELERERLCPPSVGAFYQQMRDAGVSMNQRCLRILMHHASSIDMVHRYLLDFCQTASDHGFRDNHFLCLMRYSPCPEELKKVPMSVCAAYIHGCVHNLRTSSDLLRIIHLIDVRMHGIVGLWLSYLWRPLLKELSKHHRGLHIGAVQHLKILLQAASEIERRDKVPLTVFNQICITLRKIMAYEVNILAGEKEDTQERRYRVQLLEAVLSGPTEGSADAASDWPTRPSAKEQQQHRVDDDLSWPGSESTTAAERISERIDLFRHGAQSLKRWFRQLVDTERALQSTLQANGASPSELLTARGDPFRVKFAKQYLYALAYLGECEELANAVSWLLEAWGEANLVGTLEARGDDESLAELAEPLFIYRLLAEPYVKPELQGSVARAAAEANMTMLWPNDEAIQMFVEGHDITSLPHLSRYLKFFRRGVLAETPIQAAQEEAVGLGAGVLKRLTMG